jgi:hypothetical protein
MLLSSDDSKCSDDGCIPAYVQHRSLWLYSPSEIAFSSLPFIVTFFVVAIIVTEKLFPILSNQQNLKSWREHHQLATHANQRPSHHVSDRKPITQKISAILFSTTVAFAAVLAEIILCEISNSLNPAVRSLALKITITSLLLLLIVVIPYLELHTLIASLGWSFRPTPTSRPSSLRMAWLLQAIGFGGWIVAFWYLGKGVPQTYVHQIVSSTDKPLREACLDRVGVIGISLMATLSGFASVSSPWQNFGLRVKPVTEASIARKQAGLDATNDMLASKQSRLRALEHKLSAAAPQEGLITKVMTSLRGNADLAERKSLQLEIAGLETMRLSLSSSLSLLQARRAVQQRSATATGRLLNVLSYGFSVYCVYRISATTLATLRRWWAPDATFSSSDPINNVLALLAKHWDPALDRLAWSRQISFALSGVILLASFSSVLQTVHFLARFTPGLLHHAHANLALLVSQIAATYMISSALLLRSNLPSEVGSVISDALGAPLEPIFVDRWFEGWFLVSSAVTAAGIWAGRRLGGSNADAEDDDWEDAEMGKRS